MLKGILGDVNDYTFSIYRGKITPISDLSKQIYNNIVIDVAPFTRGVGYSWEIQNLKNSSQLTIKIQTFHISCSSDSYNSSNEMTVSQQIKVQAKFKLATRALVQQVASNPTKMYEIVDIDIASLDMLLHRLPNIIYMISIQKYCPA